MMLRPRHLTLSMLLVLPLCCLSVHAQQKDGLQQRMSQAEFKAAGLDKLSAQELENLDSWLSGHAKVTTKVVNASGKPVFYADDQKRSVIETRINGPFDGWRKHQEFVMANGQHWESIDPEAHSCRTTQNAEVKIKPSLMGSWLMYVPSCYENVHVKRLR